MAIAPGKLALSTLLSLTFILVARSLLPTQSPIALSIAFLLFLSLVFSNSKQPNTPPGPLSLPIFGNWLQVGNDLNHRFLANLSQKYGNVFLLKLGARNLVVVSDPKLATEVLHTQGVEFGSRPRNVVFDIFTGNGQDMVFTVYGDHWRKMRRIMTLPFFTNKVVQQYREMWEEEMDLVVKDLGDDRIAQEQGMVIRRRLQLMLYNIMYRMTVSSYFPSICGGNFVEIVVFAASVMNYQLTISSSTDPLHPSFGPTFVTLLMSLTPHQQEL